MLEKYWIKCPICNGKTRVQVFYNTVLRNFPLFCPKCKLTHIVDVEKLEIIIKNSEKQKEVIIPAPFEPPVRSLRATLPAHQSHTFR